MITYQNDLEVASNKVTELTNNITQYKQQQAQSTSPEIQALEEENIELLKENKELRKEVAVHKATIDKTSKQASTTTATTTIPAAFTEQAPASPRQFGTDLGKRIHSIDNIHNNNTHTTDDNNTATTAASTLIKPQPTTTTTHPISLKSPLNNKPETRKMKSRRMSGPLANVGDENTPAECTQS